MTLPSRSPVSWQPPSDWTLDQYQHDLNLLLLAQEAIPWRVGDCLLAAEERFGEEYVQAIPPRYSVQTLLNYRWVAKNFPASRRRESLPFALHAEVAGLEPAEQDRWLDRAEAEGWTRAALRQARKAVEAPSGSESGEQAGDATEPEVEILPPEKHGPTEMREPDAEALDAAKRAFLKLPEPLRQVFREWLAETERPVFDSGQHAREQARGSGETSGGSSPAPAREAADSGGQPDAGAKTVDEAGGRDQAAGTAPMPAEDEAASRDAQRSACAEGEPGREYPGANSPVLARVEQANALLASPDIPSFLKRNRA